MPKVELFISTYHKDFPWLVYCLRSIRKYVTGFHHVTVHVPRRDYPGLYRLFRDERIPASGFRPLEGGLEWPNRGFMWRQHEVCHLDYLALSDSDFIAHLDADSVFNAPTTPEQFFKDGKPYLRYEPYATAGPVVAQWQTFTQRCLPFPVQNETMRCYPFVYPRKLYPEVRRQVAAKVRKSLREYLLNDCPGAHHPWGFTEYNTLGSVAMQVFPNDFVLVNTGKEPNPPTNLELFWSHGGVTPTIRARMVELGLE